MSDEPETPTDGPVEAAGDSAEQRDDKPAKKKHNNHQRPERQAARYRVERNQARAERDEARLELAFTRAAGSRFVDPAAAFRLADRSVLSMGEDGAPMGVDDAIEALVESQPFLLADEGDDIGEQPDPFKPTRSSGRVMNGPKKAMQTALSRKQLEARYPALRRGR